jgi:single stranded DNA-binding protein
MPELRMPSINQVALTGTLTQDPEARQTETGQFRLTFPIEVNRPYKDEQGNWQQETTVVPVCAFDKLAELAADRLAQGKAVFITGRLKSRGTGLEVVARHIQFLPVETPQLARRSLAKEGGASQNPKRSQRHALPH